MNSHVMVNQCFCKFYFRLLCCVLFFFFFSSRRRHTRSDRDWSSDVCSSDLSAPTLVGPHILCAEKARKSHPSACTSIGWCGAAWAASTTMIAPRSWAHAEIGRASCRERV